MEQKEIMRKSRKKIEKLVLLVYGVYAAALCVMTVCYHWGSWIYPVVIVGFLTSYIIHTKEYRDYIFRAQLFSAFILLDYCIYGMHCDSYITMIASLSVLAVLLSIFRIEKIVIVTAAFTAFLYLYHLFVLKTVNLSGADAVLSAVLQGLSLFAVEGLAYYQIRVHNLDEAAMLDEVDAMQKMEQSKDDFMANLSHEIRTPVNTVVGMTEMILHDTISESVRDCAVDVQMASRNLLTTVSDVLDFSELQSGKIVLTEEPYNLTSTINDILNIAMAQKKGKKFEVIVDCDTEIPCGLLGDEQKISRVLSNILSNSLKFTKEGAIIMRIEMRREEPDVNLIISIRDTGIGIEEKNIEKLFTSFNQVDTKRNRQEGGLGLGLAISKALVEKMHGFINVRSRLGEGTEVRFVIPQKVVDNRPMIKLEKKDELRLIIYIKFSKFASGVVQEAYKNCIQRIEEQLELSSEECRNLSELKRRVEQENFTHLFIGWEEYMEDKEFFDSIQEELSIVLITDERPGAKIGAHIRQIYKPFYALSVAAVLNDENIGMTINTADLGLRQFVAPEASVLVVDDNIMNLRVMEGLLHPYKLKVFTAISGQEALDKLATMSYDFIFMDHMMPEMDGVECFHRIRMRTGKYFREVPIIILTANAIAGAREMFLSEGFQDFLAKPVELSALDRVLRKHVPEEKIQFLKSRNKPVNEEETQEEETQEEETETILAEEAKTEEKGMEMILSEAGIDMGTALELYGGEIEFYKEMLEIYADSAPDKLKEVTEAYEKADWKQYTILVHSVKSNAGSIGAEKLFDMAKKLEMAGKEDRIADIRQMHDAMMEQYRKTADVVERAVR